MTNPFRRILHEYFHFKRSDRNAIIILCVLIVLVVIINGFLEKLVGNDINEADVVRFENVISGLEKERIKKNENYRRSLFGFNPNHISEEQLDSLELPAYIKRNLVRYRGAGGKFHIRADFRKLYGVNDSIYDVVSPYLLIPTTVVEKPDGRIMARDAKNVKFDPNNTSVEELLEIGFNEFQSRNLLDYIKKGGRIRQPEDLLKIYGVDSAFFIKIREGIEIEKNANTIDPLQEKTKFALELNAADSIQLIELIGIGPVFASRIIKYRDLLGGFIRKEQLLEIYNFSEETFGLVEPEIYVDSTRIKKIRINFAEYIELLKHPYLNKQGAKAIVEYRTINGAFKEYMDIIGIEELDSVQKCRIIPYLSFN